MQTSTAALLVLMAVLLVLYVLRRRARLSREGYED